MNTICFFALLAMLVASTQAHYGYKSTEIRKAAVSSYGSAPVQVEVTTVAAPILDVVTTAAPSYGAAPVEVTTLAPVLDVVTTAAYGAAPTAAPVLDVVTEAPTTVAVPVVTASSYGAAPVQVEVTTVAVPVLDVVTEAPTTAAPSYGAAAVPVQVEVTTLAAPVVTASSYGAAPLLIPAVSESLPLAPTTELVSTIPAPEFDSLCASKRIDIASRVIFYLPHPTERSSYIQCDEFGKAFLKRCPSETVFTENLVCEKIGLELPISRPIPLASSSSSSSYGSSSYGAAMDAMPVVQSSSSYGSGVASASIDIASDAPEFAALCEAKRLSTGSLSIFYLPHPTIRTQYLQCDEFGKVFLKKCPADTVFTENLVCERVGLELPVLRGVASASSSSSYGSAAPVLSSAPITEVVSTIEAPEFISLCEAKRLATGSLTVFYLPHPTERTSYIQCDEFGKAFLKRCPSETIFTENLTCERVGLELPISTPLATASSSSSYGAAVPVQVEVTTLAAPVVTASSYGAAPVLDVVTEAPTTVAVPVVTASSYGAAPVQVEVTTVAAPILDVVTTAAPAYGAAPVEVTTLAPVMDIVTTAAYGAAPTAAPVLDVVTEAPTTAAPVVAASSYGAAPLAVERPVAPVKSSYGAAAAPVKAKSYGY